MKCWRKQCKYLWGDWFIDLWISGEKKKIIKDIRFDCLWRDRLLKNLLTFELISKPRGHILATRRPPWLATPIMLIWWVLSPLLVSMATACVTSAYDDSSSDCKPEVSWFYTRDVSEIITCTWMPTWRHRNYTLIGLINRYCCLHPCLYPCFLFLLFVFFVCCRRYYESLIIALDT